MICKGFYLSLVKVYKKSHTENIDTHILFFYKTHTQFFCFDLWWIFYKLKRRNKLFLALKFKICFINYHKDKNYFKNANLHNLSDIEIYIKSVEYGTSIYLFLKYLASRDMTLTTKAHLVKAMVFPVAMYGCELDYKEIWAPKNWCFWTVVLEKTLESPLDCKEIQPVHPKGDQSWMSIGRTDVEAETPILWPPDAKSWLIWKDPDAGKDGRQEEKGMTEDEMAGWHHQLNGHEFG